MNSHISHTNTTKKHSGYWCNTIYLHTKYRQTSLRDTVHKGKLMDIYLLAFMIIVLLGSVLVYVYYLKEKKEHLDSIRRNFCPKCHQDTIILTDKRSGGCSSPELLSFSCESCGYANSFSVHRGDSCGSGKC